MLSVFLCANKELEEDKNQPSTSEEKVPQSLYKVCCFINYLSFNEQILAELPVGLL